jgi:DNA polymerase-3 subunit epsilon
MINLLLDRPLVTVDLETTGVHYRTDRIVQIGLVKLYPDGRETEWETLVNPLIDIPAEATAVHHITNEMVDEEPTFEMLAPILAQGLANCDLAGYNAKIFDVPFLIAEFDRCGIVFLAPRVIDSFRIFTKFYPRNLTAAVKVYLGEDLPEAHSALADAKASLRVLKAQLVQHEELPRTVTELHEMFVKKADENSLDSDNKLVWKDDIVVLNFGKHAGTPLKDANRGYLQWIIDKGKFAEDTKRIISDALNGKFPERKPQ